jgi:hypothetical protein
MVRCAVFKRTALLRDRLGQRLDLGLQQRIRCHEA